MIVTVEATEFIERAESGRSRPMLCVCDEGGEERAAYVKYDGFHEELTSDFLVAELVANIFARDLGLPAADPCLVTINPEFVDALPNTDDGLQLKRALGVAPLTAFGSTRISPVKRWVSTDLVHKSQRREAALLYLFDTLVENSDRGHRNPNLLMSGLSFKVIDFGHSFQRCHRGAAFEGSAFPWRNGGIANHYMGDLQHVMFASSRGVEEEVLTDFTSALDALTDARIEAYIDAVPAAWGQETALAIIEYLLQARQNSTRFAQQVRGVLR